jgi:hypothetical protein
MNDDGCYGISSEFKDITATFSNLPQERLALVFKLWWEDGWEHLSSAPSWATVTLFLAAIPPGTPNSILLLRASQAGKYPTYLLQSFDPADTNGGPSAFLQGIASSDPGVKPLLDVVRATQRAIEMSTKQNQLIISTINLIINIMKNR